MIKKIVIMPQNEKCAPITFMAVTNFDLDSAGILTILTRDNYRYTTNLPFLMEELIDG